MRKITKKKLNSNIKKGLMVAIPLTTVCLASSCGLVQKKEFEHSRTIFTSDGRYYETKQFESFDPDNKTNLPNNFVSYGAWELNDNGKYQRAVKEYDVRKKTYEDIKGLGNDENQIKALLGDPTKSYIQVSDTITKEDIDRGSYYEATLYSVDEKKYVAIQNGNIVGGTLLVAGLFGFVLGVTGLITWNKYDEKKDAKKLELKR